MNIIRKFVIVVAVGGILLSLCFTFNYNDLSWNVNKTSYLLIFSQICVIVSMVGSIIHEKKKINHQ